MTRHETRLQRREEVATGTMAFHFEKPAGFDFKPGQAIDVLLPSPIGTDPHGLRHTFSIVSAPYEGELVVATRLRDTAFKRSLKALPLGSRVEIEGPFGSFTLHNARVRPAVFIAGGIGITPFISMLRQATRDRSPQQRLLLYTNRRPDDAAYIDELKVLERRSETFRLVATTTEPVDRGGSGGLQPRRIDGPFIQRAVAHLAEPVYYVAGPPGLVEGMRRTLNDAGVDDDDIRSEDFHGY
ncbi:MAG: FAD-dependent oxidoreductase [Burkholderiaceae bacterium]|nr:FAD-dependent oxidoreductase [Burkholderiaceae bacterium]